MGKMFRFSPEELTSKQKKKILIGSVIPRPIALVSTKSSNPEVINIAPFSYFNIVTYDPPILSIAVQRKNGQLKDTSRNIFENKEAVIQLVDESNIEAANASSASLRPEESELKIAKFTKTTSKTVKVAGLKESKIRLEAELHDAITIYNEKELPSADLILLKIKYYHLDQKVYQKEQGYIDPKELKAVSRLAGNDYAKTGEIFTVERPE